MKIPAGLATSFGRQGLIVQKNSPQLLFGAGIVGVVSSTVLACRSTLKMEEVLEKTQKNLKVAKELDQPEEYSEQDRKKDIAIIYVRGAADVARLYGPSIVVGALSIAALTQSHRILSRRNAALVAAYSAVEQAFKEYRQRAVEKYGEDVDRELRYSSEKVEVVDEVTGKKKKVTRAAADAPSQYAKFFDQYSPSWSKESEYNYIFLKAQQNFFNDLLHARGHVFLNEVYKALGIPHTKAGAVVGWILSDTESGDNFIDFGLSDGQHARDFVNGPENAVLLDFNVDGLIYDKIEKPDSGLSWQE